MSNVIPAAPTEMKSSQRTELPNRKFDFVWPFVCLLLIEIIAFGINTKNVGVYQDEWIFFGELHFVPHSILSLLSKLFWDRSGILVLGTYPSKNVILYCPEKGQWVRISTRKEFIERAGQFGWKVAHTGILS